MRIQCAEEEKMRSLKRYFSLGLLSGPQLGVEAPQSRRAQVLIILAMYAGVLLGVIAEYPLRFWQTNTPGTPLVFEPFSLLRSFLVATLAFPLVFPRIFALEGGHAVAANQPQLYVYILQFFVAFQNGFFWKAVLI
jgi:hypothetical protein